MYLLREKQPHQNPGKGQSSPATIGENSNRNQKVRADQAKQTPTSKNVQSPEGNWTLAFTLYNGVFPRAEKYVVGWKSFLSCLHTSGHSQIWENEKYIYLLWKIRAGFLEPPCRAGDGVQIQLENRGFGRSSPFILTFNMFKSPHSPSWAAECPQLLHGQESCHSHQGLPCRPAGIPPSAPTALVYKLVYLGGH